MVICGCLWVWITGPSVCFSTCFVWQADHVVANGLFCLDDTAGLSLRQPCTPSHTHIPVCAFSTPHPPCDYACLSAQALFDCGTYLVSDFHKAASAIQGRIKCIEGRISGYHEQIKKWTLHELEPDALSGDTDFGKDDKASLRKSAMILWNSDGLNLALILLDIISLVLWLSVYTIKLLSVSLLQKFTFNWMCYLRKPVSTWNKKLKRQLQLSCSSEHISCNSEK